MRKIVVNIIMIGMLIGMFSLYRTTQLQQYQINGIMDISNEIFTDIYYNLNKNLDISVLQSIGVICNDSCGGACVVIDDNLILTAGHCVDIPDTWVEINGKVYEVVEKYRSTKYDIGFVRIKGRVHHLELGDMPKVLDTVWLIGSPYGYEFKETITKGIISHLDRDISSWKELIQTDAEGAHGSSGGPLLDINGNILGICVTGANPGGGVILCEPITHIKECLNECSI